ncbi:HutD family protein [Pseudarthrobacter sp. NIBRBAC000502772]|uniref:HutD/Ves family protein n=1 Tax=Pseudarthrobacter sp. NIBRBAC000502772 TaxID=2590775 RepID=UPI00113100C2|nr:HutD family protein [Pseudarthrobacter sp. NIBRBAC000502772]QDG64869.1 HutD family protein [Pseudarthrobacter sp. NIBRBAC000502772]
MEIIRFAELRSEPWRNGGGVTRELASHPKAASSQDGAWDWRVSIADVSKAGDFSAFPGMERVLTVIDGELLLLTVDGAEHPLEKYRPFRFSGEAAAHGALPTGDIRDLNVITRTGSFKGFTSIIELSKKRAHPVFEGQLAVLLQGQATVSAGNLSVSAEAAGAAAAAEADADADADADDAAPSPTEPEALNRYDAVVGSDTGTPEILGRGFLAVVSIDRVTA